VTLLLPATRLAKHQGLEQQTQRFDIVVQTVRRRAEGRGRGVRGELDAGPSS
jgi:hypothetical protein